MPSLLQPAYEQFTEDFDTADLKAAKALLDALAEPADLRTRDSCYNVERPHSERSARNVFMYQDLSRRLFRWRGAPAVSSEGSVSAG
jgi:hypothetical protein